ncbi:hypothetical protein DY000_02026219 [Brassica cretica]|uniref:Uncharacterized protein n=1 Tax=Brassica cretica TaxID=69181 RepID=A0ABQ7E1Q6_BRACR|nr:hypothetical protein DY000_02026219 [Brassica cretica]
MYKQRGIRCSDALAKSTTGSMNKLAKGTSYSGAPPNSPAVIYFTYDTSDLEPWNCDPKFFSTKSCEMLPKSSQAWELFTVSSITLILRTKKAF